MDKLLGKDKHLETTSILSKLVNLAISEVESTSQFEKLESASIISTLDELLGKDKHLEAALKILKLESTSQIGKLDKLLGKDGKWRPSEKWTGNR